MEEIVNGSNKLLLCVSFIAVGVLFTIVQGVTAVWVLSQSRDVSDSKIRIQVLETQRQNTEQIYTRVEQLWAERQNSNYILSQMVTANRELLEVVNTLRFQQAELKAGFSRIEYNLERRDTPRR